MRTGPDGERQENTEWFRVRVTGVRADHMMRLNKGTRVLVIGRLDIGQYQSKQGETRTSFDVWADEMQALGPRVAGAAFERRPTAQAEPRRSVRPAPMARAPAAGRGGAAVAEADPKASSGPAATWRICPSRRRRVSSG